MQKGGWELEGMKSSPYVSMYQLFQDVYGSSMFWAEFGNLIAPVRIESQGKYRVLRPHFPSDSFFKWLS